MTTRELASEYRLTQWAEKLRQQKTSGQNIRQWCEANGITRQRYHYWQRKLRQAASEQLPGMRADAEQRAELCIPSDFAQVRVVTPPAQPMQEIMSNGQIQIEVGGVRLTADASYPPEQLVRLVRELAGLC